MRLSELNTDRALDVMCELTPYINNITSDPDVVGTIGKVIKTEGQINKYGLFMMFTSRIAEVMPALLKTHRPDVYGILSILNEKSADEIAAQPALETMRQLREVFQDKELLTFFKSSMRRGRNEPSAPSAPSPGSE